MMEELRCPHPIGPGAEIASGALHQEEPQAHAHVVVELDELDRGVSGAKVVAPADQNGVQIADQFPHIFDAHPASTGPLSHSLPYPLHASRRGPPMKIEASNAFLQQPSRHSFPQMTTEKVEASPAVGQLHSSRLPAMQLQLQPSKNDLHSTLGFLARFCRLAHHDKIIGVAHQLAHFGALPLPHYIEKVQVDVREQR